MMQSKRESRDVIVVGGGPGGLAAALTLGRARRRVLLCDSGPKRNEAAQQIHNFVTRDGTPPEEFRRIGGEQLAAYSSVEVRAVPVESISGTKGRFEVKLPSGVVEARRVLLCTGMRDDLPAVEGVDALWGRAIFQCPYCHGWEVRDRRWGYLAHAADSQMFLHFALLTRGWTRDVTVFTGGEFEVDPEIRSRLERVGIRLVVEAVTGLVPNANGLEGVRLSSGVVVPCDVIFTHPPQRQVDLIGAVGLELDDHGYVRVDPMTSETSIAGIYAAGDLTTRMQGAIFAAAAAVRAAAMINAELAMELGSTEAA